MSDVLIEGLTHYWPINNDLKDVIGNSNLINGVNLSLSNDRFNTSDSSLAFKSGYIEIPDDVYLNIPFTVAFWLYATPSFSLPSDENNTISEMTTDATPKIYLSSFFSLFELKNAQTNYFIMNCFYLPQFKSFSPVFYVSGTSGGLFSINSADTNVWVHLAAAYDGKYGYVYVNGRVSQQKLKLSTNLNENRTNYFGRDHWVGIDDGTNLHTVFEGKLDDIRIYNRALTNYEINALILI